MNRVLNKIWMLAVLTLCAPPLLLVLALILKSYELLFVGFLATIVALLINSFLSLALSMLWFVGFEKVARGKPGMLILLFCAGIITNIVILWLMPPLAK